MARRDQPRHPGGRGQGALRDARRTGPGRLQRQGSFQDLAQQRAGHADARHAEVPGTAARQHRQAGRDDHPRTRQDSAGCRGRDRARPGSGRARMLDRQPAVGRVRRECRIWHRRLHPDPAAGRVCRHHRVQLPGDAAVLHVPDCCRLRQQLRAQAL
ncbi:hypothetical protein G6F57_021723 [Rhizopus arrhizus]|nr:hypothetical protein G6F57_021723 [Rhizopus arrhizus]